MYFTYILYSSSLDKYYIGSTEDLERRIQEHNNNRSSFTKGGAPWKLVWHKTAQSRAEAMQEEMLIKRKKSRKYIEYLIS